MLGKILLSFVSLQTACFSSYYIETIHPKWHQNFSVEKIFFQDQTDHQNLVLFENETFGRVLALDGAIQVTEKDEFIYQEMLVQVPIFAHGKAKKVLIIGGGDGAALREVLKHPTIEKAVLVEIDDQVVEFSKTHLPFLSQGAFEDPRAEIIIEDGCKYVKESSELFDVIICDSTDPTGPGAVLFTPEFYADCKSRLSEGGIFVNQSGVPFMQPTEIVHVNKALKKSFKHTSFYFAAVPTYVGGVMAFGFATDSASNLQPESIERNYPSFAKEFRYYTPSIHKAAFAMPKFIEDLLK